MVSEENVQENTEQRNEGTLTILAMVGGLGITMMVVAAGIGVVWENADSGLIGLVVMMGVGLLVASIGGWVIVVRPHEHIDDINQPMYHGHHHDDDHADDAESDTAH